MSFALTQRQISDGSKTVTRRDGWRSLRVGDEVLPVAKCMGLKKGEKQQVLCSPLIVASVRQEALQRMLDDVAYGQEECCREGFPELTPQQFVEMFCATHPGCSPDRLLTRVEFHRQP